jgi:hypothetical protein
MMLGNTAKRYLHNLYSLPNIVWIVESRRMKRAKQVACTWERSAGRREEWQTQVWEDAIKSDPTYNGAEWLNLAQDRDHWQCLIYTVMKRRVS